jgi:hypothetical protein
MKKLKNETALVKEAVRVGGIYAEKRGVGEFEGTDSAKDKAEYVYRLLVNDKLIQPLPKADEKLLNMKRKLAIWISKTLPKDHELLK